MRDGSFDTGSGLHRIDETIEEKAGAIREDQHERRKATAALIRAHQSLRRVARIPKAGELPTGDLRHAAPHDAVGITDRRLINVAAAWLADRSGGCAEVGQVDRRNDCAVRDLARLARGVAITQR